MSTDSVASIDTQHVAAIAKPYRLQFEQAQDSWVLLYPEGMVKLNGPAGEILKRMDGLKNIDSVVDELETAFEQKGLRKDVVSFIEIALQKRWITLSSPK